MIDIRIVGEEAVMKRLTGMRRVLKGENRKAMQKAVIAIANRSKTDYLSGPRPAKLGVVTNRLRSSITTKVTGRGKDLEGVVGTNVWYGETWEKTGLPARDIFPVNKKALFWPGASHPVKHVHQKAKGPRPFLAPALEDMKETIIELFGGAVQIAVRK